MGWIRAIIAVAVVLGASMAGMGGTAASRPAAGAQPVTPRFESTACHFTLGAGIVAGKDVRCGFAVVPEDRSVPHGRTIRLAVAIFKSPNPHPAPDPFVFLQGGPGGSIVGDLGSTITRKSRTTDFPADRDLVLIDQRGTGLSQPSLACQENTALHLRTLDQRLSLQQQSDLGAQAALQCRNRLVASGINPNAYTSLSDAADVADLRVALGYRALNLYSVSYGTRVALTVMRTHPQGIRSVILDSVEPPGVNAITNPLSSIARVFGMLFSGCAANRACNAAYPHLQQTFYRVVQRLNATPVTIHTKDLTGKIYTVLLTGNGMIDLVFSSFYYTWFLQTIPGMIYLADHGDFSIPSSIYGPFQLNDASDNLGVYYSVQCGEDAPFTTVQQTTAAARVLDPVIRPDELSSQLNELQVCRGWHANVVPAAQRQPVSSAIPTLILSGEYDPITPPADSLRAAQTLTHSYRYVFPGTGHGVYQTDSCPTRIVAAFEDTPTKRPDAGCIAAMKEPQFLLPRNK